MARRRLNNGNNDVNKIEKEVLTGVEKTDFNHDKMLTDIEEFLDKNNMQMKKYTGNNVIELLTSLALAAKDNNPINSNNPNLVKKGTKNIGTNRRLMNDMVTNNNLLSIFELEKKRIERYQDYKMIETYIPQLAYCIDIIKSSIISPDNITKEFLNINIGNRPLEDCTEIEKVKNVENMQEKFKLNTFLPKTLRDTILLGDQFVAILSYKKEMEDILLQKQKDGLFLREEEQFFLEDSVLDIDDPDLDVLGEAVYNRILTETKTNDSKDDEKLTLTDVKKSIRTKIVDIVNSKFVFTDKPIMEYMKDTVSDIDSFNNQKAKTLDSMTADKFRPLNLEGAFIQVLDPKKTVKLFKDGLTYGYVYIEQMEDKSDRNSDRYKINDGVPYEDIMSQINGDLFAGNFEINEKGTTIDKDRLIVNAFGKVLSKKLNRPFITKNKEFIEYIYGLSKANQLTKSKTKIVYFSPDEVVHFKFNENKDGYGTSSLAKSLFFAMIYVSTVVSELMTKIARGRDTRAIFVDVGLEGDIEGAIQNTISDIKSKEINIDNLSSISSIIQTLSTFDDYFIPTVDGERPIEFDTVPGGGADVDTEFLDYLLKSAVAGTNVPGNMVDAAMEVEFSRTIVSNNDQFARMIINMQMEAAEQWSEFINILYNAEYTTGENADDIEIDFPTPMSLMLNNMNENISNSQQTIDFIVSTYVDENTADEADMIKKFKMKKAVTQEIVGTIDWIKFDKIFKQVEDEAQLEKYQKDINPSPEDDMGMMGMEDEDMGGGSNGGMSGMSGGMNDLM